MPQVRRRADTGGHVPRARLAGAALLPMTAHIRDKVVLRSDNNALPRGAGSGALADTARRGLAPAMRFDANLAESGGACGGDWPSRSDRSICETFTGVLRQ